MELPLLSFSHLPALDVYLWLEHASGFFNLSLTLNYLLSLFEIIFTIQIEISELLMNLPNLLGSQSVGLSVDQALDGGQLVKNYHILIRLLYVQVV